MPGNPRMRTFSQTITIRMDGSTDGQTDRRTDKNRQTIAVTLRLHFAARVKTVNFNQTLFISVALVVHAPGSPSGHKKLVCVLSLDHQL